MHLTTTRFAAAIILGSATTSAQTASSAARASGPAASPPAIWPGFSDRPAHRTSVVQDLALNLFNSIGLSYFKTKTQSDRVK